MRLEFLFLGKTREAYLASGIDDYRRRLANYAEVEIRVLKEIRPASKPEEQVRQEEGLSLLAHLPPKSLVVALDPGGRSLSSEELALQLGNWQDGGRRHLVFLVGGALGLAAGVMARAEFKLSLSRMTFTHEMARLLLLEQLYRAFSIRAGSGYHK
ncbi:MAG: 23S rRNA (pseudouridine(1915)-N(3))-methyltransferase RlmH [Desulfobulbaceae bacterium]|nr:23S rRNA (pseudouridine(1915)-N(3))-methyltransferase RlmH [Desulfobulbaceae bacterium]